MARIPGAGGSQLEGCLAGDQAPIPRYLEVVLALSLSPSLSNFSGQLLYSLLSILP